MKRNHLLIGIVCLALFSACKKDQLSDGQQNNAAFNLKQDGNNWDKDDDDDIFYALGEGNKLDKYSLDNLNRMMKSVTITGVQPSEKILAIDFRPATGQLYGLGNSNRIYVINLGTGVARPIGAAPFSPALAGTFVGFDFNPTVDRIRVVTNTGQNFRLNPETGALAATDGSINGVPGAMITSVAYSNNVAGAATTILYDIDVTTDKLYKQNPPNLGGLELVGSLGVDIDGEGGFDIAAPRVSDEDSDGSQKSNKFGALAIYRHKGKTTLFSIDLTTGDAKKLDKFECDNVYYGIAIPTQPVAFAVSGSNLLIFNPNSTTGLVSKPITGLQVGESLVGIDFRPVNGQLTAISSNSRIYTIGVNATNGIATFIAMLSTPLNGTSFAVDFNPVPDRIRIVSNTGQNLRVNPLTGATTTDTPLNPGTPSVSAAAYSNNFAGTATTTLYVIDPANDKLFIQSPPNNGTLTEVGNLGVNIETSNGFDIGGTSNKAYGAFTSGSTTRVYHVDLTNGKVSAKGSLPVMVSGFTIGLGF